MYIYTVHGQMCVVMFEISIFPWRVALERDHEKLPGNMEPYLVTVQRITTTEPVSVYTTSTRAASQTLSIRTTQSYI